MTLLRLLVCFFVCAGLLSPVHSEAADRVSYGQVIKGHTETSCLMDNLINETRGVRGPGAHDARVEIAHLVLSRTQHKEFAPTVCAVIHQKGYNKHLHKHWCEFSWICSKEHVAALDVKLVKSLRRAVRQAEYRYHRWGALKALYYTSNGTCPVRYKSKYRKGPFTFCVSEK